MLQRILISILISSALSAGVALLFSSFWTGFIGCFCLQIVIYNLFQQIRIRRESEILQQYAQRLSQKFEQNGTTVPCAYCRVSNFIPINFQGDNSFECPGCKKVNSVLITVDTIQKTDYSHIKSDTLISEEA